MEWIESKTPVKKLDNENLGLDEALTSANSKEKYQKCGNCDRNTSDCNSPGKSTGNSKAATEIAIQISSNFAKTF